MDNVKKEKSELNEEQLKAVEHKSGPILVVAGAGTGKTRVITERIKHLIQEKGCNPNEILALTFTDKAAEEMVLRIGDIMPLGYEEPWVSTFHSFADRILRERGIEIGIDPSYKIISGAEQWMLIRKHLFSLELNYFRPLGNPTKFISEILKFISKLQDENIKPKDLETYVYQTTYETDEEKLKYEELSYIYTEYERLKIENSMMDFGNLISWLIELFTTRPNILSEYQKQFKHVLVDEFQDTNYSQYELIKLLFPTDIKEESRSLLTVGDDSQSIYKFRGAAISNILQFMEDYKNAEMVTLIKNYRSTQEILDPAYKLIQNNNPDTLESKLGISKKLISAHKNEEGNKKDKIFPEIIQADVVENEVSTVIQKIVDILAKEPQYTYKDIAILARANNHLDPFVMALRKEGLPYQLVGNRGLYDRDEVRNIIALIKVVVDTSDGMSLYRVLNIESLDISYEDISYSLSQSRFKKVDLWEQIKESKNEKIKFIIENIENAQKKISKATPTDITFELVNSINYLEQFLKEETVENELCIRNLNLFLTKIQRFEVDYYNETKEIPTLINFVDYLDMVIEAGENPAQAEIEDIDTINLMTVHSSKGLEFPVVFMVNLISGRFPTRNRKDTIEVPEDLIKETLPTGDEHLQEERRLFYVGMTRAKKYLFMTLSKNYGGKRDTTPSGYLQETGLKIQEIELDTDEKNREKQTSIFGVETSFRDPKIIRGDKEAPSKISYSQIDNYLACPLRYKFSYILNVPTPPSSALNFGNTIHNVLKVFHTQKMFGREPSFNDLLKTYEKEWIPLGYDNEEHRKKRFDSGKKLLEEYYQTNKDVDVQHLGIEKEFILDIDGIKLKGKIDRIDKLPDGSVEIIDYKTGNSKTQKEVDNDVQMTIYKMAAEEALNIKPDALSFYYLETGEKISTNRTQKQVDAQKQIIKDVVKGIKEKNFKPNPGQSCRFCPYREICPFVEKD
jgi:DNA helicase-2/ATP-dependent DNA helicase PcrA